MPRLRGHAATCRRYARFGCGPCDHHQLNGVATLERQRLDLFVIDDRADGRIARLDERRGRFDRHRFLHAAQLQRDRDHRVAVDLQHDSGLREGAEAGEHGLEAIRSERQIQQSIRTGLIGHRFATETGLGLYRADGNARENAATRIDDSSVDLGGSLSPPVGGTQEQDHNNADERARNAIHSKPPRQLTSPPDPLFGALRTPGLKFRWSIASGHGMSTVRGCDGARVRGCVRRCDSATINGQAES